MINITFKAEKKLTAKAQIQRALRRGEGHMKNTTPDYDWSICPMPTKRGARFTLAQIWSNCIKNIATLSVDDELLEMPGMYSKECDVLPTCIFINGGGEGLSKKIFKIYMGPG